MPADVSHFRLQELLGKFDACRCFANCQSASALTSFSHFGKGADMDSGEAGVSSYIQISLYIYIYI